MENHHSHTTTTTMEDELRTPVTHLETPYTPDDTPNTGMHHMLIGFEADRYPELSEYEVMEKIGEGTFSVVWRARCRATNEEVALKIVTPTSGPSRTANEMDLLLNHGGHDFIVEYKQMIRCTDHTTIVMRYFEHDYFKDYLFRMDVGETQRYMFALFRALYRLHADNIMHRDIKPSNFLANENRSDFLLVDFGLAERWSPAAYQNELARLVKLKRFYEPSDIDGSVEAIATASASAVPAPLQASRQATLTRDSKSKGIASPKSAHKVVTSASAFATKQESPANNPPIVSKDRTRLSVAPPPIAPAAAPNPAFATSASQPSKKIQIPVQSRGGTRGYRPPEVLARYRYQTSAIDMWSAGVILLSIMSRRSVFFFSNDDCDALEEIASFMGTQRLHELAEILGRKFQFSDERPRIPWRTLINTLSKDFDRKMCAWPDELFDLLGQLLELNPAHRISAADAMRHPFFRMEPIAAKRHRTPADDLTQSRHHKRYSLGKEPCSAIWELMQRTICTPTDADWAAIQKALKSASRLKRRFYSDNAEPGPDETSMMDAILPFLSSPLLKRLAECLDSLPADQSFPELISDASSPRTRRLNQSSSRVRNLDGLEDMAIAIFSRQERQYFQSWRSSEELVGYPLADVKPMTRTERHQKRARDAKFNFKTEQQQASEN